MTKKSGCPVGQRMIKGKCVPKKIKYKYIFEGIAGGIYSYNSNNPQYAKQRIATIYNIRQKNLKLVKKEKIQNQFPGEKISKSISFKPSKAAGTWNIYKNGKYVKHVGMDEFKKIQRTGRL